MSTPLVSVVISSFNYAHYLGAAIDSALAQVWPATEVIVVDDGSTDESCDIVRAYGDRLIPVLKENAGQASALNAGFAVSSGAVLIFLDADDVLLPDAASEAVAALESGAVKAHWPLLMIDAAGAPLGRTMPADPLPDGDLREITFERGPSSTLSAPTSGNAWTRKFLEQVLPIPETSHRINADAFLFGVAPAFGPIRRVAAPQACYRVHSRNNYHGARVEDMLRAGLATFERQCAVLARLADLSRRTVDTGRWIELSHFRRLERALRDIESVTAPGSGVILVDDCRLGICGGAGERRYIPLPERGGVWWGCPADGETAIEELERTTCEQETRTVVFAWPAFWWLEHFTGLSDYLRTEATEILSNSVVRIFELADCGLTGGGSTA